MMANRKLSASLRLAFIYLAFSVTWILVSDEFVYRISPDKVTMENLQNIKGIVFVTLSSLLLYFSSRKLFSTLNKTLKRKEELLGKMDALNKATREGIIDYHFSTDTAVINEEWKNFLQVDSTIINDYKTFHRKHIHPSDLGRLDELFQEFIQSERSFWQTEYRFQASNGTYRDIISRGYIIRKNKQPSNMILALQDVTVLRDANSRYYEQQMLFRQSLTHTIIDTQEKERNRWAEELHDNIGQVLTVGKLYIDQVKESQANNPFLVKAGEMVESAIAGIRQLSSTIKPPQFERTSLQEAIQDLANNIRRFNDLNFTTNLDEKTEILLKNEHKLMVYRIIQEQVNNILKYAQATDVQITISIQEPSVWVKVMDNGIGFNPEETRSGIGIKNIRSRLQAFSGTLAIHSGKDKGTELVSNFSLLQ